MVIPCPMLIATKLLKKGQFTMNFKYLQPVAEVSQWFDRVLEESETPRGMSLLDTWGITETDLPAIREEAEAMRYVHLLRLELAREKGAHKPTVDLVNRALERHLAFLNKIHGVNKDTFRKSNAKLAVKRYIACRHYLFKFSLPAWYVKLPDYIPTFEEKYGHDF